MRLQAVHPFSAGLPPSACGRATRSRQVTEPLVTTPRIAPRPSHRSRQRVAAAHEVPLRVHASSPLSEQQPDPRDPLPVDGNGVSFRIDCSQFEVWRRCREAHENEDTFDVGPRLDTGGAWRASVGPLSGNAMLDPLAALHRGVTGPAPRRIASGASIFGRSHALPLACRDGRFGLAPCYPRVGG